MDNEKTGLLVIRAWIEHGSTKPLRAHIQTTADVAVGFDRTIVAADADQVRKAVDVWLSEILGS